MDQLALVVVQFSRQQRTYTSVTNTSAIGLARPIAHPVAMGRFRKFAKLELKAAHPSKAVELNAPAGHGS
jgi:hypothetical protein